MTNPKPCLFLLKRGENLVRRLFFFKKLFPFLTSPCPASIGFAAAKSVLFSFQKIPNAYATTRDPLRGRFKTCVYTTGCEVDGVLFLGMPEFQKQVTFVQNHRTMVTKSQAMELLRQMPEEFSIDELMERLIVLEKIAVGLRQVENGEIFSEDEARQRLSRWLK